MSLEQYTSILRNVLYVIHRRSNVNPRYKTKYGKINENKFDSIIKKAMKENYKEGKSLIDIKNIGLKEKIRVIIVLSPMTYSDIMKITEIDKKNITSYNTVFIVLVNERKNRKYFNSLFVKPDKNNIEVFSQEIMSKRIWEYFLQPQISWLDDNEKKELIQKTKTKKGDITFKEYYLDHPIGEYYLSDPMVKIDGAKIGDIAKISRATRNGLDYTWRIVIHNPDLK